MKKYVLLLIMFYALNAGAQTVYNHKVFWMRLVLADKISKRFNWELYLQERTQNKAPQKGNMWNDHQFGGIWPWINYNAGQNLKLSLTPLAYFNTNAYNLKESDTELPGVKEYRWAVKAETRQPFVFLTYINRYSIEYRLRDLNHNDHYLPSWRIRYAARLEKPVKGLLSKEKPLVFFLSDELFLQFGYTLRNNPNVFNQNRINIGASYEVIKNVKFSVSYLNILQERNDIRTFDNAHTLWIILTFDNLFTQLSKKPENDSKAN